jgi:hypothetical protein
LLACLPCWPDCLVAQLALLACLHSLALFDSTMSNL